MDHIRKVVSYLKAPDHVAEFQKLCGIQVFPVISVNGNGCDSPCANGPSYSQNGEAGKIIRNGEISVPNEHKEKPHKNGLSHKVNHFPFEVGLLAAALWTTLVILSRIYLGMHTGLDVLAGLFSIMVLLPPFLPYLDTLDDLQVTHHWAPLVTLLGPLLLCHCYPTLEHWSTTRGDTALILSVGSGISVGTWLLYQGGWMQHNTELLAPIPVDWPSLSWLLFSCIRLIIGVLCLAVTRTLVKPVALRIICFVWGIDIQDTKHQRALGLEVPHKFFTYFLVSVCATYAMPVMFSYLGIIREGFFLEL